MMNRYKQAAIMFVVMAWILSAMWITNMVSEYMKEPPKKIYKYPEPVLEKLWMTLPDNMSEELCEDGCTIAAWVSTEDYDGVQFYNGTIDDVRVFDHSLDEEEILSMFYEFEPEEEWVHVSQTFDINGNMQIYVDGELVE